MHAPSNAVARCSSPAIHSFGGDRWKTFLSRISLVAAASGFDTMRHAMWSRARERGGTRFFPQ
jgi:hypothetical protein